MVGLERAVSGIEELAQLVWGIGSGQGVGGL